MLLLVLVAVVGCAPPRSSRVVIGAKNFTEQVVMGELLAQEIEAVYAEKDHNEAAEGRSERVDRRFYLAGSYLCQQALVSGRIDGYVEYTGTALTAILKQPLPPVGSRDAATVLATVRRLYAERYRVEVGAPLGFEDTFAMVVRGEDARRWGVRTISDVARMGETGDPMVPTSPLVPTSALNPASALNPRSRSDASSDALPSASSFPTSQRRDVGHPGESVLRLRLGVGYEFEERPDGLRGLEAAYGLRFAGPPRVMDLGLLYRALEAHQVDIVAGNSTDGPIRALGLTVLQDDRHYFPPYEAVPLVREDSVRRHPEIQVALDRLAGKVSAEEVQAMNDAVDAKHRDVGEVVREFRTRKGL